MKKFIILILALSACEQEPEKKKERQRECTQDECADWMKHAVAAHVVREISNARNEDDEHPSEEVETVFDVTCFSGGREILRKTVNDYYGAESCDGITIKEYLNEDTAIETEICADCIVSERRK